MDAMTRLRRLPVGAQATLGTVAVFVAGRTIWSAFVRTRGAIRALDDFRMLGIDYPMLGDAEKMAARITEIYSAPGAKLTAIARELDVHPYALANVIHGESGWNAKARNPESGAVGLLQWTPTTARDLGTSSAQILAMGPAGQLDLVGKYLARVKKTHGSLGTIQRLGMAVFYPKAMRWFPTMMFPSDVRSGNPGIAVVADYIERLQDQAKLPWSAIVA